MTTLPVGRGGCRSPRHAVLANHTIYLRRVYTCWSAQGTAGRRHIHIYMYLRDPAVKARGARQIRTAPSAELPALRGELRDAIFFFECFCVLLSGCRPSPPGLLQAPPVKPRPGAVERRFSVKPRESVVGSLLVIEGGIRIALVSIVYHLPPPSHFHISVFECTERRRKHTQTAKRMWISRRLARIDGRHGVILPRASTTAVQQPPRDWQRPSI